MKLKRIALLTDGLSPWVTGGMQQHSTSLARWLGRRKIFTDVFYCIPGNQAQPAPESLFSSEELKYIKLIQVPFPQPIRFPGHYIRSSRKYACRLAKLIEKEAPYDFIYAKGFTGWKLLEMKKSGATLPPIGVKFHGYEMFQPASGLKSKLAQIFLLRKATRFSMVRADYLFSYGGKVTETIISQGIPANRMIEIPTGIESDYLIGQPKERGDVLKFLFIGRWEPRKNLSGILEATKLLSGKPGWELHVVGPVPRKIKREYSHVLFHGKIEGAEKMKHLVKACDILLCPSFSEGMPNVILEGMAAGLAIIATDVGAVKLMVSEENGWLLQHPEEILKAMEASLNTDKKQLQQLKVNSIQKVKNNFLWEIIIQKIIAAIESRIS